MLTAEQIQIAHQRLKDVVYTTPLQKNQSLSKKYDCNIWLKREDMQVVRSFKIRGAFNKISSMEPALVTRGIVCASAGNHAQGVAFAAAHLHIFATIYMPSTTSKQKISKVRHFGGEYVDIVLTGDNFDDAFHAAVQRCESDGLPFIHPFDDVDVMAGQGTVGLEMLEQCPEPLDILLVAVGGGGLLSGVGSYFKQISPQTKIIAVESGGAPALHASLNVGQIVTLDHIDSFADGIAVKRVGDQTFKICKEIADEIILVPEGQICSTMLKLYNDEAIVTEPAGAISISALALIREQIKGKSVGIIICGGNNDISRTEEIRERALLWENRKHYFIVRFPQRAGALRDFLYVLGPDDDITHFAYTKKNNRDSGPALVGIELKNQEDFSVLLKRMTAAKINFEHINNNPMLFEILV